MSRIVIDARESGTTTGRYVDKLIEHLHTLKPQHEIIILAKSPRMDFFNQIAPDFKVIKSNHKEFTFAEQIGLLRQIKKLRPDLVHFSMTQQPAFYKGRAVTTIHDLTTVRFENPGKNLFIFKFKQKVYAWLVKRVAKQSAYIITPTDFVKQDVAQYAAISPGKIFVTYEAADIIPEAAQPIPRLQDKRFIMYVGRPLPHKNLGRLIDAYVLLKKKYPELMLVLAGKLDRNYHFFERKVTNMRMADSVVFTDFVTEGELKWLYQNTAAYIFPSLSEGFGLPGLEAMAHGAPLVSSSATCLPEVYGDAANYFDPANTIDMAVKISEVVGSDALRNRLIIKGRLRASNFSWQKTAAATLRVYEAALKNT
ncbi:MAG TPA: glycosyltransferase family 1 protein [Candidatus Saccharimonadales bacterium]|nr:glycosyltransferase family 1 protein [Candidatus Saccharimonadales bacterium]